MLDNNTEIKESKVDILLNNKNKTKKEYNFKKGNKFGKGRPKGSISLLTDIKRELKRMADKDPEEYKKLIRYYIDNEKTRDLLIKMIDGMPKQRTELTGKDGGDIKIVADEKKKEIDNILNNLDDTTTEENIEG